MNNPPKRLRDTLFLPAMDWTPIGLVIKDFPVSSVILIFLFLALVISTKLFLYSFFPVRNFGGFDSGMIVWSHIISMLCLLAGVSTARDETLWPILPMGIEQKSMIHWLRCVFLPWMLFYSLTVISVSITFFIHYFFLENSIISGFHHLKFTGDLLVGGMLPLLYILRQITEALFSKRSIYLRILIWIGILAILGGFLAHYTMQIDMLFQNNVIPIFSITIVLLYGSYLARFFTPISNTALIHKTAKSTNKPMPKKSLWSLLLADYVTIFGFHGLVIFGFVHGLFKIQTDTDTFSSASGKIYIYALYLVSIAVFLSRHLLSPMNARILCTLPLGRWHRIWITSWEAGVKVILQLIFSIALCVFMALERGEALFSWRGNLLGWILLIAAAAMLIRPLFYYLSQNEKTAIVSGMISIFETLFALFAIDVVWSAAVYFKRFPTSWLLNESSIFFIGGSALFFLFAIATGYRLTDRVWNMPQIYRRPTEIKQ